MHRDAQLMPWHSTLTVPVHCEQCQFLLGNHTASLDLARPCWARSRAKSKWVRDVQAVWDALDIERVKTACDPGASADLAAVLITVCQFPKPSVLSSLLECEHWFYEWWRHGCRG